MSDRRASFFAAVLVPEGPPPPPPPPKPGAGKPPPPPPPKPLLAGKPPPPKGLPGLPGGGLRESKPSGTAERPPLSLAIAVGAAVACALVLLRYSGPAANLSGFLVGAVAGPLLLIGFLVINNARKSGGKFGDWRWLPSSPTMAAVGLAGWAAGAAHVWFYAKEVTRWLAG